MGAFGGPPIFMPSMPAAMPPAMAGARPQGYSPQQQAGGYVPPRLTPPANRAAARAPAPAPQPRLVRGVRGAEPVRPAAGGVAIPTPGELGVAGAKDQGQRTKDKRVAIPTPDELGVAHGGR
jgi:hypothetical protein